MDDRPSKMDSKVSKSFRPGKDKKLPADLKRWFRKTNDDNPHVAKYIPGWNYETFKADFNKNPDQSHTEFIDKWVQFFKTYNKHLELYSGARPEYSSTKEEVEDNPELMEKVKLQRQGLRDKQKEDRQNLIDFDAATYKMMKDRGEQAPPPPRLPRYGFGLGGTAPRKKFLM
jgi:hypothetical protein